jgi:predicted nucleic acid-binding protein
MKNALYFVACALLLSLTACGDKENVDDKVQTKDISRDGAIETVVTTEHLSDSTDLLVTTHKIWKNNAVVKETRYVDTLPTLGTMTGEVKDEKGNKQTAQLKKDYEFYITVK